jgi:hypothetical protein
LSLGGGNFFLPPERDDEEEDEVDEEEVLDPEEEEESESEESEEEESESESESESLELEESEEEEESESESLEEEELEDEDDLVAACLAAKACICCANNFGAFFKCSRSPSVNPPNPMEVKKLIANLVFLGLSLGNNPEKISCMYTSLNRSFKLIIPRFSESS